MVQNGIKKAICTFRKTESSPKIGIILNSENGKMDTQSTEMSKKKQNLGKERTGNDQWFIAHREHVSQAIEMAQKYYYLETPL